MALMVFSPRRRVSWIVRVLEWLIEPATTRELGLLATSVASPVIIDSSTSDVLAMTVPSVAIDVLGKALKMS